MTNGLSVWNPNASRRGGSGVEWSGDACVALGSSLHRPREEEPESQKR